jgi:hypothetical protein
MYLSLGVKVSLTLMPQFWPIKNLILQLTSHVCQNSSLFDELALAHECQKRPNLHTNELNTMFFCSTSPVKAPNRLKPLKLA